MPISVVPEPSRRLSQPSGLSSKLYANLPRFSHLLRVLHGSFPRTAPPSSLPHRLPRSFLPHVILLRTPYQLPRSSLPHAIPFPTPQQLPRSFPAPVPPTPPNTNPPPRQYAHFTPLRLGSPTKRPQHEGPRRPRLFRRKTLRTRRRRRVDTREP
jgi:hypothetical protein